MATNEVYKPGYQLSVVVTDPATPTSGQAVRYGMMTGVAMTDEGEGGNAATETTVDFGPGVYSLPVKGEASAIAPGDAVFYDDAIGGLNNDAVNGYFFGIAREAVENGATSTIEVQHVPSPGAGSLASGSITTAKIAAGAVTEAKIEANSLTGLVVENVADKNVIGGIPVIHRIDIAAGANANVDVTLTHKTRVIDAWLVLRGAGVASETFQIKNGANAISNAMAASGSDQALVRAASIDDAYHEIAAGGTLRVTGASGASMPDATIYVAGIRVA